MNSKTLGVISQETNDGPADGPASGRSGRFKAFCLKICPCLFRDRLKKTETEYVRKVKSRPVYRDDAFYTHSMALLPEYDEMKSLARSGSIISPSFANKEVRLNRKVSLYNTLCNNEHI